MTTTYPKTPGEIKGQASRFARRIKRKRSEGHLLAECAAFEAAKPSAKRSARMRAFGRTDAICGRDRVGTVSDAIGGKAADLYAEGWKVGHERRKKVEAARRAAAAAAAKPKRSRKRKTEK